MIVGRESEITQLENILHEGQHMLVVVSSKPGMGRSALLQEYGKRAENFNWRVLPAGGTISITQDTTDSDFFGMISFKLPPDLPEPDMLDQTSSFSRKAIWQEGKERIDMPSSSGTIGPESITGHVPSGTLIMIDSYQPNEEFETRFLQYCIPALRRSTFPLVIIVAGYPGDLAKLSESSNIKIKLESLPKTATIQYFENLNSQLSDKMNSEEIEAYATSSSEEPGLINIITNLLQLQ